LRFRYAVIEAARRLQLSEMEADRNVAREIVNELGEPVGEDEAL
jgi:hypothetical protein